MSPTRTILAGISLAVLLCARPAEAKVSLGLGADWLLDPEAGELQLTLAPETMLAKHVWVGARFGAMYLPDPDRFGVPLDGFLRIRGNRFYVDGLVGPWFVFDDPDNVRFHLGFGFGLMNKTLSFGVEVGRLGDSGIVGVRAAFPL